MGKSCINNGSPVWTVYYFSLQYSCGPGNVHVVLSGGRILLGTIRESGTDWATGPHRGWLLDTLSSLCYVCRNNLSRVGSHVPTPPTITTETETETETEILMML